MSAARSSSHASGSGTASAPSTSSACYAKATDDFYVPEPEDVRTQVGKPGAYSFEPVYDEIAEATRDKMRAVYETAYLAYEQLVELGVARELARSVLPVGAYTEFYWTVNARSLMNFLSLRNSRPRSARSAGTPRPASGSWKRRCRSRTPRSWRTTEPRPRSSSARPGASLCAASRASRSSPLNLSQPVRRVQPDVVVRPADAERAARGGALVGAAAEEHLVVLALRQLGQALDDDLERPVAGPVALPTWITALACGQRRCCASAPRSPRERRVVRAER